MSTHGIRSSVAETRRRTKMYRGGMTAADLAEREGIHSSTMSRWLHLRGFEPGARYATKRSMARDESRLGILQRKLDRHQRAKDIRQWRDEGHTWEQIAKWEGMTICAAQKFLCRYDATMRGESPYNPSNRS